VAVDITTCGLAPERAGQAEQSAQHPGDLAAESASVGVGLVQHEEAQRAQKALHSRLREAPVQFVGGGGDHPDAGLKHRLGAGGALKGPDTPRKRAEFAELFEFLALVLPERHERIDEQRRGVRIAAEALEDGGEDGARLARRGGRGDDDVFAPVQQTVDLGLMAEGVREAESGAYGA
jgi:hypothetical protein